MDASSGYLDEMLDRVLIGGREPATVRIVAYDQNWPAHFATHRARIVAALGALPRRIEHIGSTSVPGLAAKPIIDILVTLEDVDDEAGYRSRLEAAGYVLRVREPGHRMFRTPARDTHVHLWPAGSSEEERYLRLRDWLRVQPADRTLYERVKRELAQRTWTDMNYYAEAKSDVIAAIMERADAGRAEADG